MSYVRYGNEYKYVEGSSDDYIFHSSGYNGRDDFIEDYDNISNDTMVELICRVIESSDEDRLYKDYLKRKLAEKLNVELKE